MLGVIEMLLNQGDQETIKLVLKLLISINIMELREDDVATFMRLRDRVEKERRTWQDSL